MDAAGARHPDVVGAGGVDAEAQVGADSGVRVDGGLADVLLRLDDEGVAANG